jgi:hypothetical protein
LGKHPINQIIIAQVRLKKAQKLFLILPLANTRQPLTKPDNPYQQKTGFGFGRIGGKSFNLELQNHQEEKRTKQQTKRPLMIY